MHNILKSGTIVTRAYAYHIEEWGIIVDEICWKDTDLVCDSGDAIPPPIDYFVVMWPGGNLTEEMDAELLSIDDYNELVARQSNKITRPLDEKA